MEILGIRVDRVDMAAALDFIAKAIQAADGRTRQIITLNAEGIVLARQDAEFQRIIRAAELVTPDGAGVLWAAEQLGQPLPERVTGIDLLQAACARAAQENWRVFLLGAVPGVAEEAAAALQKRCPGLQIVGTQHGQLDQFTPAELLQTLRKTQPDLLFVALGMPRQEKYISAIKAELRVPVVMGVGGSFDVLAGRVKRAPQLLQKLRLEWLWRLILQPSRLPRALALPRFMRLVKKEARQQARRNSS